jgi:hypothetical protein
MTGGQIAPTTPHHERTATSPYGNPEKPFDLAKLAEAAGATYVARWTTNHPVELTRSLREALSHPGFAFIEVLSQCPTQQRRMFGFRDPVYRLPTRILKMFSESTFVNGRPEPEGYRYAVPQKNVDEAMAEIETVLQGKDYNAEPVDHMSLGRVVRVEPKTDEVWEIIGNIKSISKMVGPIEGKVELGVFVKKEHPEFTEILRRSIEEAGER